MYFAQRLDPARAEHHDLAVRSQLQVAGLRDLVAVTLDGLGICDEIAASVRGPLVIAPGAKSGGTVWLLCGSLVRCSLALVLCTPAPRPLR